MEAQFAQIPTDKIVPCPYQQRKTFGGPDDDELAASIKVNGVLQPIRVRPNGKPGIFELVFGERRWRAAKTAKLDTIPALVGEMTDEQVIRVTIIENLQRKDIHPLEEGEGYRTLLDKHGYTIEKLIAETGRSKAHLYGRMKLARNLAPGPRKAVIEGKLPIAHAELIARIGDAKLQEQCTKEVLGKLQDVEEDLDDVGIQPESIADDGKSVFSGEAQPLSYRATQALIRRRYMTKLSLAKFSPAEASLTSAGACTSCEHRSGNQPELPGLLEAKGGDVCTKPSCFEAKTRTAWDRTAAAAAERGLKVVESADAKKVFSYDGVSVCGNSPYVELTSELPYDLAKTPGSKATWGKLLGKAAAEIPRVLVQDESGAPRELLDKNAAVKKLRELGKVDKPTKATSSSSGTSGGGEAAKARAKRDMNEGALQRVLARAAEKAAGEVDEKKELSWLRWLARAVIRDYSNSGGDGGEAMLKRRGLHEMDYDQLGELVAKAKSIGEVRAVLVELELAICSESKVRGWVAGGRDLDLFEEGCKLFGADWDKALEQAKAAAKAEAKVDAAKKKAPAKKKGKG